VRTAREIPTLVVVSPTAELARVKRLEAAGLTIVRSATLQDALQCLQGLGILSLLVEGGGQLAGALLTAGLVDRYYWIQAPILLGDDAVPALSGLPARALDHAERWRVIERRALGEDTLLVVDRA
jgi:diaminohydroxyphosphoribosylaminopyrimidine deaminase/5-amino-6-(5-phosphoribosylamino)uracil reductase